MKTTEFNVQSLARLITVLTALFLASAVQAQTAKPPQEVKVVNTASQPVPVTGTVELESGASVGISGTPTVNLAAGSSVKIDPANNTVQVGNTAASPVPVRDVDMSAAQPFQTGGLLVIPDGQFSGDLTIFTVAAGKRFVIEYVDLEMRAEFPPDTVLLKTTVGGELGIHFLFPVRTAVTTTYGLAQQIRLYADSGTNVIVHLTRIGNSGQARLIINISGYFVDVP